MATEDSGPLRRGEPRSDVVLNEVRGIATHSQGREQGPFILWDISDNGLRLWMPHRLKAGDVVKLTVARPFVLIVNADVKWCRSVRDGSGFHVGMRVLDNLHRLEALHRALNHGPNQGEEAPLPPPIP